MPITACRGTVDLLPGETARWAQVEGLAQAIAVRFGYKEIRTPAFEVTELFTDTIGEDSDIVEKELYTFRDKSGRSLTLRPEMTTPTIRAYLEHNLGSQSQIKTYYVGEIYRYERPNQGKMREAHQFGVEAIGSSLPAVDAELVDLALSFFGELGLKDVRLEVNSIGCKKCRPTYQSVLRDFFTGKDDVLCPDCERRKERNPIRVMDCRREGCMAITNTAPTVFQSLCTDCKNHFFTFKDHLTQMGYQVHGNPRVVHGLNYYSRTVFQIHSAHLPVGNPLCSGGRFDDLIAQLSNSSTPGIGFAVALERTIAAMEKESVPPPAEPRVDCFLVGTGEEAERIMTRTMHQLRKRGYRVERDYSARGMKNQLKMAEKFSAAYTALVGEEDTRVTQVQITDNSRGTQENVNVGRLIDALEYRLRRDAREKGRDRGRERGEEESRRERGRDRVERDDRHRERGGRDRGRDRDRDRDRERGEDADDGARFAEWAATYAEAARSAAPRAPRRIPLADVAVDLMGDGPSAAMERWAITQSGLAEPRRTMEAPWPAQPLALLEELPPKRPAAEQAPAAATGNWLEEPSSAEDDVVFEPDAGYDSPAGQYSDADDESDDEGEESEESEDGNGDAVAATASGADRKRRGGRRGGRRHGRRKSRNGKG